MRYRFYRFFCFWLSKICTIGTCVDTNVLYIMVMIGTLWGQEVAIKTLKDVEDKVSEEVFTIQLTYHNIPYHRSSLNRSAFFLFLSIGLQRVSK
jgi:hypothetical protein